MPEEQYWGFYWKQYQKYNDKFYKSVCFETLIPH